MATGGLCNKVNIYNKHPELKVFKPWIALLYTDQQYRNKGLGSKILAFIEKEAKENGINSIYLYTFTAESLYKNLGWRAIKKVDYKGHETMVMTKDL